MGVTETSWRWLFAKWMRGSHTLCMVTVLMTFVYEQRLHHIKNSPQGGSKDGSHLIRANQATTGKILPKKKCRSFWISPKPLLFPINSKP